MFHARGGGDGTETKNNMKRFTSKHLGRVIDYHVMMYSSSRYLKARSVLPILSISFVTSINDETLECFPDHSWPSGRRLASHKHLPGSSSRRPKVASVPSSLQDRKWPIHRWCNMGNGRAKQGGFQRRKLEASKRWKRWRPRASSRVETGCLRGRDELLQGEERRTTVSMVHVCLAWCRPPVFRSPSF